MSPYQCSSADQLYMDINASCKLAQCKTHRSEQNLQRQEVCTDRGTDTGKHTIRKMHVGRNGLMIQSSSNRLMTRWSANTKQKVAAVWYSGHHDTDSGQDVRL